MLSRLYVSLLRRPLAVLGLLGAIGCTSWGGQVTIPTAATGFTLSASPTSLQIPAGGSGYAQVSVSRACDCTGAINLGMAGLPEGVVASGTISAGAGSGVLTIMVDPSVSPQALGSLVLDGRCGTVKEESGFALTVAAALPAPQLSPSQVMEPGGLQTGAAWFNTGQAMEPVAHDPASNRSGTLQNRAGFLPTPTPSTP
jgi:hypothetical protein